ncbi:acyl-CoA dehydrogenase family protein [Lentzea sp. NPDC051838]|uniref:acyl-CoA dehydrogenase family protein n=1 Tax=Lentzea sp. NPDC051838 TaxID=3154849 RepID=UPI003412B2E6
MTYRADLLRIVQNVVAPSAADVDQQARFPRAALNALGARGLLGMTISRTVGGGGQDLRSAGRVVEEIARVCGATASVLRSHYSACAVLNRSGPLWLRAEIAAGRHLSTLAAFGASGSVSTHGDVVQVRARKSWVIAAGEADSYVWSCGSALLLVPAEAPGLLVPADHAGMGLRGTVATCVEADPVRVPASNLLWAEELAFPWFLVLGAAVSLGLMEGALAAALGHLGGGDPRTRADLARMRLRTDSVRVLYNDTLSAVTWHPERSVDRVRLLAVTATEAAVAVTDMAMKVCGDAAFRRDLGIERRFRDARAAAAIEPTVDVLLDSVEI